MAKKNKVVHQIVQANKAMLDIGVQSGKQQIVDCLSLALHDPEVMGKGNTFGRARIERVLAGIMKYDAKYAECYSGGKGSAARQAELDEELKKVWGPELVPFRERQPYVKN